MAFSPSRLERLHRVMSDRVEGGEVPGLVMLVSRRGEVHCDAIGTKAIGGTELMERNTIFRLASLTKPIVAVAAMSLVEECVLRLDDPIENRVPELADRHVLRNLDGPVDDTVPADRSVSIRDLLTMRMGFGAIPEPGNFPIRDEGEEMGLMPGPPQPQAKPDPDEWIRRLGTLPLMYQPGERWMYDTSFRVLGVLLARAAGQPLETVLRERIFEPLGMKDTGFSVPEKSLSRLASCYESSPSGRLALYDGAPDSQWSIPPTFPDAAGGLVSTVDDLRVLGEMMLDGGKHGDMRILSRPTVEAMTTPQITPAQRESAGIFLGEERSWGFGVSVITQRNDVASVPGRFGWDGGFGTSWYTDPTEDLVGVLMYQRYPPRADITLDFWTLVYQAIDD